MKFLHKTVVTTSTARRNVEIDRINRTFQFTKISNAFLCNGFNFANSSFSYKDSKLKPLEIYAKRGIIWYTASDIRNAISGVKIQFNKQQLSFNIRFLKVFLFIKRSWKLKLEGSSFQKNFIPSQCHHTWTIILHRLMKNLSAKICSVNYVRLSIFKFRCDFIIPF